jgi:hypothetical protein
LFAHGLTGQLHSVSYGLVKFPGNRTLERPSVRGLLPETTCHAHEVVGDDVCHFSKVEGCGRQSDLRLTFGSRQRSLSNVPEEFQDGSFDCLDLVSVTDDLL